MVTVHGARNRSVQFRKLVILSMTNDCLIQQWLLQHLHDVYTVLAEQWHVAALAPKPG